MSRKKRSLKERLIGLVVVLVVASAWFAFRRSLDSVKEIVKPANMTVLAEKLTLLPEREPRKRPSFPFSLCERVFRGRPLLCLAGGQPATSLSR